MSKCHSIILAAGLSSRMGPVNKLLVDIGGEPMIRSSLRPYLEMAAGRVLVVTGHEREAVETALAGLDVEFVHNPRFAEGQKTSVAAGLGALSSGGDVLVGLGDMPFVTADDLTWLRRQHAKDAGARITVPRLDTVRGNPILIPQTLRSRLLADQRNPGCGQFTRANPEMVQFAQTERPGLFHDLDWPEDLAQLGLETCS